jgi:hypothetical protein
MDIEQIQEKQTDYKPYNFKLKRFYIVFTINVLTYEDEELSITLPSKCEEAQKIVDLLNVAFQEGYQCRAMSHRCDQNWRGQKLLTVA